MTSIILFPILTTSVVAAVLTVAEITCFTQCTLIFWWTGTSEAVFSVFTSGVILTWMARAVVILAVFPYKPSITCTSITRPSILTCTAPGAFLIITEIPRLT